MTTVGADKDTCTKERASATRNQKLTLVVGVLLVRVRVRNTGGSRNWLQSATALRTGGLRSGSSRQIRHSSLRPPLVIGVHFTTNLIKPFLLLCYMFAEQSCWKISNSFVSLFLFCYFVFVLFELIVLCLVKNEEARGKPHFKTCFVICVMLLDSLFGNCRDEAIVEFRWVNKIGQIVI